mgnify:CR=1 FL=1
MRTKNNAVFLMGPTASGKTNLATSLCDNFPMEIISVDFEAGRLEAVETSFWFGFKDDIVVRVQEAPNGVRIDIRSKSRVGQSDLSVNAKRVLAFIERFTSGN